MKRIAFTATAGVLIALISCPGALRAQPKDKPDKVTLSALAAQVAALQATVSSLASTVNSQQTTLNSLQNKLSAESPINALAANFLSFDGSEAFSNQLPLPGGNGGTVIYDNSVTVPPGTNTLYVTIDGTADLNRKNNELLLGCLVDGVPCNNGRGSNGAPTGWVMIEALSDTAVPAPTAFFPDNDLSYTWCAHLGPANSHSVELRLASGTSGSDVFVEQFHVFVNGATIQDPTQACTPGTILVW